MQGVLKRIKVVDSVAAMEVESDVRLTAVKKGPNGKAYAMAMVVSDIVLLKIVFERIEDLVYVLPMVAVRNVQPKTA